VISHYVESFFFGEKKNTKKEKQKYKQTAKTNQRRDFQKKMINLTTIFGV